MPETSVPKAKLHNDCPIHHLLDRLGDKWSLLVIAHLANAKGSRQRFSELMRTIDGISQRMLALTLRHLERDGLVTRDIFPEIPPRVEYELTQQGKSLMIPVRTLIAWIEASWPSIEQARESYDLKNPTVTAPRPSKHLSA